MTQNMPTSNRPFILMIGCGRMGSAMLNGWLKANLPFDFAVFKRTKPENFPSNVKLFLESEALKNLPKIPDMIVLAVKPNMTKKILGLLSEVLTPEKLQQSCLFSVMAGIKTTQLTALAHGAPAIAVMPNIAAELRASATSLFIPPETNPKTKKLALQLVEAFGSAVPLRKEEEIQPAIGLAGSGSAYVFLLAELLEQAGVKNGLGKDEARKLSRDMIYGAGVLLKNSPSTATALREQVTSPNGTTAAALSVLMTPENWPNSVNEAVKAAIKRTQELSNEG
ncbi:pyrroline-5-carboxylate reductase [Acetobacteraceae bacterium]|nr:pyrroline-5-carboxylate reductase [Acetobacteraceae bacterium]QCE34984.1 pyrroline-5-carboxylate reductase [Acetobacteraceae bacterium]